MRPLAILISGGALAATAVFGQTLIEFTPGNSGDPAWQLTGALPIALTTGTGGWVLPAGAQISRAIGADQSASSVSVTLTARPLFSIQPKMGPVLELGSEDLVFLRTDGGGQLVLLSGTGPTSALPGLVSLDASGFSTDPLTIQLGYDPASRTYSAGGPGGTITVPAVAGGSGPTEIALSSGSGADLQVRALSVSFTVPAASATATATASPATPSTSPPRSVPTADDFAWLQTQILAGVKHCLAGDFATAWAALAAVEGQGAFSATPSASDLGWRAATVVGFLKNQGKYAAAEKFASFALDQTWSTAAAGDARYWNAWIAVEGLGDRQRALTAMGSATIADTRRMAGLRAMLEAALRAFPRNQ